jgi:hypothetical protein
VVVSLLIESAPVLDFNPSEARFVTFFGFGISIAAGFSVA